MGKLSFLKKAALCVIMAAAVALLYHFIQKAPASVKAPIRPAAPAYPHSARLYGFRRSGDAPRVVLPVFGDEAPRQAIERYVSGINGLKQAGDLKKESDLDGFEWPDGTAAVLSTTSPKILLPANGLFDLYPRRDGDSRIMDIIRIFENSGLDAYVLPVVHDAGLSEAQAEEFRAAVCAGFDAAVFLGGDTPIAPGLYGGAGAEEKYPPIKERDESEIRFYRGCRMRGAGEVFGICCGAQLIAVAHGYRLYSNIRKEAGSKLPHADGEHLVTVDESSWLYGIFRKTGVYVNSYHYQGLNPATGTYFRIIGKAGDGIIEAYESPDGKVIGFQFHPELMRAPAGTAIMKAIAGETRKTHMARGR